VPEMGSGNVDSMMMGAQAWRRRKALDRLVPRMVEPEFVVCHRRVPSMRETSGHVSPAMLALAPPRSRYVRRWRRHARRCPGCAATFRFMGLPLE
jgi:hypothetical protein